MTAVSIKPDSGMPPADLAGGVVYPPVPAMNAEFGWQLLGWVGLALLVAALGTIGSVWLPAELGNVDWEFGAVADSFAALPLLAVGLGACLASAAARQRSGVLLALGVGFVLLAFWLAASTLLFGTTAVMAWTRAEEAAPMVAVGIKRVIARTLWFGLISSTGCCIAAMYSFKTYVAGPRRKRA